MCFKACAHFFLPLLTTLQLDLWSVANANNHLFNDMLPQDTLQTLVQNNSPHCCMSVLSVQTLQLDLWSVANTNNHLLTGKLPCTTHRDTH